jgi:DNA-binding NarL/FixJ family response regulator
MRDEAKIEEREGEARGGSIRVLIVDDHPVVREGLRIILNGPAIIVAGEARTGAEAIDAVARVRPDIILMDIQMPGMDGLEATAAIKQHTPEIPVIIMTSHEDKNLLRRAIQAGAAGYLLKGSSREELTEAIHVTRSGGSLIDPRLLAELLKDLKSSESIQGTRSGFDALSPREQAVLQLLTEGLTNRQIAERINWSVGTVKNAVQRIIEKLDVSDRTQAAVFAARAGLTLHGQTAGAP